MPGWAPDAAVLEETLDHVRRRLVRRADEANGQRAGHRVPVDGSPHAERGLHGRGRQDLLGRPLCEDAPAAEQHQSIAVARRHVEVVDGRDGRQTIVDQPPHNVQHLELVQDVQVRRWLVQEEDAGLLGQGAGNEHPLTFAPGQGVERSVGELLRLREPHGVPGDAGVFPALDLEAAEVGIAAHEHELDDVEAMRIGRNLRDERNACGDLRGREVLDVDATEPDDALLTVEDARQGPEERGLPRSVGAHEANELASVGVEAHAVQEPLGVDLVGEALRADRRWSVAVHVLVTPPGLKDSGAGSGKASGQSNRAKCSAPRMFQ